MTVFTGDQRRNGAEYTRQRAGAGAAHDKFDARAKALHIAVHVGEKFGALPPLIDSAIEISQLLIKLGSLLSAQLAAQAVALG